MQTLPDTRSNQAFTSRHQSRTIAAAFADPMDAHPATHCTALVALVLLLSACGAPTARPGDPAPLRGFAARGYSSVEHGATHSTTHQWTVAGHPLRLVLMQGEGAGLAPLVLYLPGLGEAPEAGAAWRTAWASAGYAVLSVQALAADATAWQSDLAREGSFRALGQRHYAGDAMARRAQALGDVLTEAQRRAAGGEAGWQHIDWTRVAVAGFDLGAYTAMVLAGEQLRGVEPGALRPATFPAIRAAVALSPYANVAEGGMDTRYRDIHAPVLSVTSDADGDPLGLVAGAMQRSAPFEHMSGPGQYLLSLQGLAHARLSGSAATAGGSADAAATAARRAGAEGGGADDRATRGRAGNGSGNGSGGRRRGGGRGPGAEGGGTMGRTRDQAAAATDASGAGGASPQAAQRALIAAQDVSTAFLDAYLRGDALAREWLDGDAARWMGTAGELRRK